MKGVVLLNEAVHPLPVASPKMSLYLTANCARGRSQTIEVLLLAERKQLCYYGLLLLFYFPYFVFFFANRCSHLNVDFG